MEDFQKKARAQRAKSLLEDSILKECFEALEAEYMRQFRASPEAEVHDEIWRRLNTIDQIRAALASIANDPDWTEANEKLRPKQPLLRRTA